MALTGHLGSVVHHLQCVVGRQLEALLPTSNGFDSVGDLPKVLPLLIIGENFDEEQPGGPLRGSTSFTVNLAGVSITDKECHAQLKIMSELPQFMRNNFADTGEMPRNRFLKLGYLHKTLEAREKQKVCEVVNKVLAPGRMLHFGLAELLLMTETMDGKPRPSYSLVPVGKNYLVWLTELERLRSVSASQGPRYTAEEIRAQDLEKQQARDLRSAANDETAWHTALDTLEEQVEAVPKVVSELGVLFQTGPGVNLGEMLVATAGPRVSAEGETDGGFQPSRYSTPAVERNHASRLGRSVGFQLPEQGERQEAKDLAAAAYGSTPVKTGEKAVQRVNLRSVLTKGKVNDIWNRDSVDQQVKAAPAQAYLWDQKRGKESANIRPRVRQLAHHLFAAWAEGVQEVTGALEQKLIEAEQGLGQAEVRALTNALVKVGTSGPIKTAYLGELIKNLGLENDALDTTEEERVEVPPGEGDLALGAEAKGPPGDGPGAPPQLPDLPALPATPAQGGGGHYEAADSVLSVRAKIKPGQVRK